MATQKVMERPVRKYMAKLSGIERNAVIYSPPTSSRRLNKSARRSPRWTGLKHRTKTTLLRPISLRQFSDEEDDDTQVQNSTQHIYS